ncbi:MAG: hypothetical protein K2H39_06850 [Paramuribaculum sp.]|nr:hypothetical protein [Paramuribaculum sp.]
MDFAHGAKIRYFREFWLHRLSEAPYHVGLAIPSLRLAWLGFRTATRLRRSAVVGIVGEVGIVGGARPLQGRLGEGCGYPRDPGT